MTQAGSSTAVGRWMAEAVRPRRAIVALLPAAGGALAAAALAVSVVRGVLPVAFAVEISVAAGRVPDAVVVGLDSAAGEGLRFALLAAVAALLLQQVLEPVQTALGEVLARRVDGVMHDRLVAASLGCEDLAPLEDERVLDLREEAVRELESAFRTPGSAVAGLVVLVARYAQLAGFCVVVAVCFSPPAAVALAALVVLFRYGQRGGLRRYARVIRAVTPVRREAAYLRDLAMGTRAAKEIRIFGILPWLAERHHRVHRSALEPVWRERRRIYLRPYLGYAAAGLIVLGAVLAVLGATAARREVPLTGLVLSGQAILAAMRLGDFYPEADTQTQYGMNAADAIARFEQALAAVTPTPTTRSSPPPPPSPPSPSSDAAKAPRPLGPLPGDTVTRAPSQDPPRVEFRGVTFRYPGTREPVFDGLDLTLEPGLCTALVGVNGAGKTTIVKLLARLYRPESGHVLVDGADIGSVPVDEWRRRLAVVFQDFTRYEATAADNIGFGAVEALEDRASIRAAAERAGILAVLEGLPSGLDTVLSSRHPGGVDLSGGQWQRIALARALLALRQGASVLVLDEPTSALDIRAEAEFFARFRELTRGSTSLLISHRFSSVRHADRILVMEDGRVVESGNHEELLGAGGRYAELFKLQADRFAGHVSEGGARGEDRTAGAVGTLRRTRSASATESASASASASEGDGGPSVPSNG